LIEKGATAVLDLLEKIAQIAKDIPPVDNAASRFGNPAFRTFYDKVSEVSEKNTLRKSAYLTIYRYRNLYMVHYRISRRIVCQRSLSISTKPGVIGQESITAVVWN
jgi:Phosphotyrosyl phosphate activator (PTPA) protein